LAGCQGNIPAPRIPRALSVAWEITGPRVHFIAVSRPLSRNLASERFEMYGRRVTKMFLSFRIIQGPCFPFEESCLRGTGDRDIHLANRLTSDRLSTSGRRSSVISTDTPGATFIRA
jgi:hypothetical protein